MEDGYLILGGLGVGFFGVKWLMDEFDIEINVGEGIEIKVVKWFW